MLKNSLIEIVKEDERYNIYLKDCVIGYITLDGDRIYIFINPVYRGKHYATNALYLFVKYAHESLGIEKLYAHINSDISKHVFEHTGFHREDGVYVHTAFESVKEECADERVIYLAGGCFWGMEKVFKSLKGVKEMNLLPYHRLGQDKYEGIGREYTLAHLVPPSNEHMEMLKEVAESAGIRVKIGG